MHILHENVLKFVQTVSIDPVDSNELGFRSNNVIEITRELDPDRKLANSGLVTITIPQSEVMFKFDNDTGKLINIVNYKEE